MTDFVWPSDRARAENDELDRVCDYLEEVLDAQSKSDGTLKITCEDGTVMLPEGTEAVAWHDKKGFHVYSLEWLSSVHMADLLTKK